MQVSSEHHGPDALASGSTEAAEAAPVVIDRHVLERAKCDDTHIKQLAVNHRLRQRRKIKKFYTKQNELIDQFLGVEDEERLATDEEIRMRPRIKFAVYASFAVNVCLFVIQLYAAISTGSLAVR